MDLNKELWTIQDKPIFLAYLKTFEQKEKEAWTRNILNTKLGVLAIPTKTLDQIAKEIYQGNYQSFLDLQIFDHYEAIVIYGKLLTRIPDFDLMTHYLNQYIYIMENWAHVDLLSFRINKENQEKFIELSHQYLNDSHVFIRRLSLMILFQMVNDPSILPIIFDTLKKLSDENEYYVIMMAGWLLSECIIKYENDTLKFILETNDLNKKILNKGIQKCRESRRLSQEKKDQLLAFKRK